MKSMVDTNQKFKKDTQEIKRKISKYNTTEYHQHTIEESKRITKEQRRTPKTTTTRKQ